MTKLFLILFLFPIIVLSQTTDQPVALKDNNNRIEERRAFKNKAQVATTLTLSDAKIVISDSSDIKNNDYQISHNNSRQLNYARLSMNR